MAYRGHVYDGEVQVAADQLFLQDGGVGLRDKDFDGRALLFEFGQYLGQYDGTQVRRDTQVNPAGFQIVQVAGYSFCNSSLPIACNMGLSYSSTKITTRCPACLQARSMIPAKRKEKERSDGSAP